MRPTDKIPGKCLEVEAAHFIGQLVRHALLEAGQELGVKGPGRVVAQHAGLGRAAEGQQEEGVGPDHLVGLHGGQRPGRFHLQGLFPRLLHLQDHRLRLKQNTTREAESPVRKPPRGHSRYLFPGGRLLFSQVFFPTAVAHQVPGATPDSAVAAVPGPAAAEVADAVVALASGVAAAACRAKKRKKIWDWDWETHFKHNSNQISYLYKH